MAERFNAVVIGGGHNGLTTAAYLAKAGLNTLVLERRSILGGATLTESPEASANACPASATLFSNAKDRISGGVSSALLIKNPAVISKAIPMVC